MKKLIVGLGLALLGSFAHSQNGLEKVIVEKYYVANAVDAAAADGDQINGTSGTLPAGSVTYRVYADMLPGYNYQAAYGVTAHTLSVSTTTQFYNNSAGSTQPSWGRTTIKTGGGGVLALDSWWSVGAAASNAYGVLKTEDIAGSSSGQGGAALFTVSAGATLQNNAAAAGIPITTQDGYWYSGAPTGLAVPAGISTTPGLDLSIFADGSTNGSTFSTNNGSIYVAGGSVGPIAATNRVLIGQFTTDGVFSFNLNLQIGGPGGSVQNFVANNPTGNEISIPSLTYPAPVIPPTVSITSPANGAHYIAPDAVSIAATAADADGSVAQVQFFVDGGSIGTATVTPYAATYTPSVVGTHTLTAVATDNDGNPTTSSQVVITVAANQAPTVSITSPANGAHVVVPDAVTVTATAADADGSVASVQFKVDGAAIGTSTITPYSATYSPSTAGTHTLTAIATDDRGVQTSKSIIIIAGANQAPTVSLTAPAAGTYTATTVAVSATAADIDGHVASVEFFANGSTSLGSVAGPASSYSVNLTTTPYVSQNVQLTAVATDDRGAHTTSAVVTIYIQDANAAYKISNIDTTCLQAGFCLPIVTLAPVNNIIGYDVVLHYDNTKVRTTGGVTKSSDLLGGLPVADIDIITSVDSVNGIVNISEYFNASAPANAKIQGSGQVFCVAFTKKAAFNYVDHADFTATLQESYFTSALTKTVSNGSYITYRDSIFHGKLQYYSDNSIIKSDNSKYLVTNIYGTNGSCVGTNGTAQADSLGKFVYTTNNGLNISIQRDISNANTAAINNAVQAVINSNDAFKVQQILVNSTAFVPTALQLVAADVNLDGKVTSGDLSQINQRSVSHIVEFKQAWNYDNSGNPTGAGPSKDWLFADSSVTLKSGLFASGYSKSAVPQVPFCLPVPVSSYSTCPVINPETYKGILVGDVDGSYSTQGNAVYMKVGSGIGKVVFDLTSAVNNGNSVDVPVSVVSGATINGLDFSLQYNEGNLNFNSVVDNTNYLQSLANYNTVDKTLRFTANSLQNFETNTSLVYVRFATNAGKINASDFNSLYGYLNGERVQVEVKDSKSIPSITNNDVRIYPNPASTTLNIETTEQANVQLFDMSGRQVIMDTRVNAYEKQAIVVQDIANGIYMMRIYNGSSVLMQKVIINR